jgi:putative ABC transport system permease protein
MLLISEIFFAFIVLFAVGSMVVTSALKYLQPLGFSYDRVWALHINWREGVERDDEGELRGFLLQMDQELRSIPQVEDVSWTFSNLPYSNSIWSFDFTHKGNEVEITQWLVDDHFANVARPEILEGRWFSPEDDAAAVQPIVIDTRLRERFFGNGPAVGEVIYSDDDDQEERDEYRVIGVVTPYRYRGEFWDARQGAFLRNPISDTASLVPTDALLLVREDADVGLQKRISDRLSDMSGGWPVRVEPLAETRRAYIKDHMMGLLLPGIVCGFLVLNVALGLFGVLWYSISRRRSEIGLRRAVGADRGRIGRQILGEALTIATFALVVGLLVAVQAPVLGIEGTTAALDFVLAVVCAGLAIYLLVALCAWYPSRLAARIQPATALHEE